MVEEKSLSKILEWMETIGRRLSSIEERLHFVCEKVETLFEVVQEIKDDMRFIKRTVNAHDDEITLLKNQFKELSKGLHT